MNDTKILDYIKKSFELKNQGYYKPAIEMLYKALAIDGDNMEILAQLAHLYKLLDNFQRAIYYIEKVLDIDNKHSDCLVLLEEIYLLQGDLQSANSVCERIYKIQPDCQNLAKRINILNKLNDFEKIKELEKSVSERDDEILYEFAYAYYNNNDFQKSIELLNSGYEKNSKNEKIMLLLAKIYYDTEDFEKSKKIFTDLEKINPTAEVTNYLGLFELNESCFAQAAKYFIKAQKADAKNAEYSYNLASAYFLNGWNDEALKYFNRAICLAPDNVDYHYSLAYLYYQKKLYDKALFELDFIKTINKNHELSNVLSAMIMAKKGDLLTAKDLLEKIIENNQKDDFAYFALSEVYKELSQIDLAKRAIKQAIKLNPASLNYLSELAEMEFGQKNYKETMKLAQKIIKLNEKYIYAYIVSAKANLELKNFDKVFDSAQDIIELDSNCPEGYYYNALSLFEQGDKNFAVESLKKAISLDLNNAMLYVKMSEFYQDLGDFKLAYEWAKEAGEIDERNYNYKWLCAKLASALHNQDEAVKYYSQSYRLGSFDKDLAKDYAKYLTSIGREKQAEKVLK
ncbi:MAG: tetratricopeptide repeat protein [Candidatus Gastranaerophilaceae bacterium]